jgi:uncharacterized protein (UPF0305 family)
MDDHDLQTIQTLAGLTEKAEIAKALCEALSRYTLADLQQSSARMEREVSLLPSPYREKVKPHFAEQYFGRYGWIMSMHGNGECRRLTGPVQDLKLYREYFAMMAVMKAPADEIGFGVDDEGYDRFRMFYYIVSAFYMFVLDQPGHPVGMPFPGGFTVRQQGTEFICPIRDKEKDVESSICNFCPAKQDEALK